jgi:myo-inositol-1(or 4)-monophosphatase
MPIDLAARHALAIDAARQAGHHLKALYGERQALVVEEKGRNDFVSRADREAEALIKAALLERFSDDGFLGEETGASGPADAPAVWAVDPLDGTTNFLKGTHNWCVSIGLLVDGRPTGGVIYDPLRDEMFDGLVEHGARVNGDAVRVSAVADPGSAVLGLGFVPRVGPDRFAADARTLLATGMNFRQFGAGALMLANVAAGRIDAYFERHMWPWDAAAGLALVLAAGGAVAAYPGARDLRAGGGVLAANAALYPQLKATLGGGADPWTVPR